MEHESLFSLSNPEFWVLVALAIFFVIGEILCRAFDLVDRLNHFPRRLFVATDDARLPYVMRPGVEVDVRGFRVRVNQNGLRGNDVSSTPAAGVHRVLAIGDSATFGEGMPVEALVDNPDRVLKPGFFAKGVAHVRMDSNVLAAPEGAISTLAGVSTVYVIEDNKARQQQITLGARQGQLVEVTNGLKGNEVLASTNLNQLATGVAVRIGHPEEEATNDGGSQRGSNGSRGRRP